MTTKTTTKERSVFEVLNAIDVSEHIEKKSNGQVELSYLSWAWAWASVKKLYPDASYTIYKDENDRPYVEDEELGLMCYTSVTIEGETIEMWLPVMDNTNKAMKRHAYTYQIYDRYKKQYIDKQVAAASMFDVNKTIMRCLVKNLAMFGLGLYIYAGEDLPEDVQQEKKAEQLRADNAREKAVDDAVAKIEKCISRAELTEVWNNNKEFQKDARFLDAVTKRGAELKKIA